jgi:hypothetical protein
MAVTLRDGKHENLPTREEFAAFWQAWGGLWWEAPYYLSFTVYGVIVGVITFVVGERFPGCAATVSAGLAAVYFLSTLCMWALIDSKRYAKFIKRNAKFTRCPQCGDWLGWDASGSNAKWKTICETGVCCKCGRRLLAEP